MKRRIILVLLSILFILPLFVAAPTAVVATDEAPAVEPSLTLPHDIDAGLEAAIDAAVAQYIRETYSSTAVPGAVVLVAKDGKILAERAYGYSYLTDPPDGSEHLNVQALIPQGAFALNAARNANGSTVSLNGKRVDNPVPMSADTLFDLASITKVMATTQGIMKLVSEGKVDVNERVSTYIPGFEANGKDNVTVARLLTHTSGLSQWEPMYLLVDRDRAAVLEHYKGLRLAGSPGSYAYSDIGFRMLGFIIEAVSGMPQEEYLKENIYAPLGLTHITFNPLRNGFTPDDTAATSWGNYYEMAMVDAVNLLGFGYNNNSATDAIRLRTEYMAGIAKRDAGELGSWRNYTLRGEVNDGNSAMANDGVSGAAGLFASASDLAVLGQMMLQGGIYNGVRIYDEWVLDLFTGVRTGTTYGYGFKLNQSFMGGTQARNINTFGHDGFTGTQIWFDKETNMVVVVLTNKMNVGAGISASGTQRRPAYSNTLSNISPAVGNAVYNYLGSRASLRTYVVQFDSGGGSYTDPQFVKPGGFAFDPGEPAKDGYTFDGWFLFDGDEYIPFIFDETPINAKLVLTALWTPVYVVGTPTVSASVSKVPGNKNELTITVVEKLSNGLFNFIVETFLIDNNAAGTYNVGPYFVHVDTKGNDQIRACYLAE